MISDGTTEIRSVLMKRNEINTVRTENTKLRCRFIHIIIILSFDISILLFDIFEYFFMNFDRFSWERMKSYCEEQVYLVYS